MKFLLALFITLTASLTATAITPIEELLGPALSGRGTVFFRVVLEKKNGVDMRETAMPKEVIKELEKKGASVRPNRTVENVSYWIFFKNGDFAESDVLNNPDALSMNYAKLVEFFSDAPRDGPKWSREGENLVVGRYYYSIRVLPANDPATGGKKGEVEIAVLDGKEKLYFYFGSFIHK